MVKWLTAIYTLIISVLLALVILTVTGVIHPQTALIEYAQSIPAFAPYIETYYIGADWEKWHSQRQAELEAEKQELEHLKESLELKQRELEEFSATLARQEQTLAAARERQLNAANLAQLYTQCVRKSCGDSSADGSGISLRHSHSDGSRNRSFNISCLITGVGSTA